VDIENECGWPPAAANAIGRNTMTSEQDHPDLVDEHFRPYVRALGNLVITFALCETELLRLVAAMKGCDELEAAEFLKGEKPKERIIALVEGLGLPEFEAGELVTGIENFWRDKDLRNRLIHDEWLPHLFHAGTVFTRGITRGRTPEVVFGNLSVNEVWALAWRLQQYDHLFSHRYWTLTRRDE